jgi:hypothetical protein
MKITPPVCDRRPGYFVRLFSGFRGTLRVIFKIPAAALSTFAARLGCTFPVFCEIAGTASMFSHNMSPVFR